MALRPIELRLDGEEIHLVPSRELERWGGFLNGRRDASQLVTPDNVAEIRHVRFDDLTEGGTVHFELSGDAVARGSGGPTEGLRYALGAPVGLVTRKRHVLVVHPNPRAFVSVELFFDDAPEGPMLAVLGGRYTLTTKLGDQGGELEGHPVRVDGFVLPSSASYAFEGVVLPPRPAKALDPDAPVDPDGPVPIDPAPEPDHPDGPAVVTQQLRLRLQGGEQLAVLVRYEGGQVATTTDADGTFDVELPEGLTTAELRVPSRGEVYTLELQPLGPAASLRGASHRLHNLGLYAGPPTDTVTPMLREAMRTFQRTCGLAATAELDPATAAALESKHGS